MKLFLLLEDDTYLLLEDYSGLILEGLYVDVTDNLTLGESQTIENPLPNDFNISVTDGITVGESQTIENPLPADFNINVTSGITVGESKTVTMWGNRYWVGGTGNWSDATNHWSNVSSGTASAGYLPNGFCNVYIDANSGFDGVTGTITVASGYATSHDFHSISGDIYAINMNSRNFYIEGSAELESGLTINTGFIYFESPDLGNTVDANNSTLNCTVIFEAYGGAGGWTLLGDLVVTESIRIYYGTFDANDFDLTADYYDIGNGTDPVIVYMGNGTWTDNSGDWYCYSSATVTLYCEQSLIHILLDGDVYLGGQTYYDLSTYNNQTFWGGGTFHNFTIEPLVESLTANQFEAGKTITVNGEFSCSGDIVWGVCHLIKIGAGDQWFLSKPSGTVSCDYLHIENSNAGGGAAWFAGSHSEDTINNDGWIFGDYNIPINVFDGITIGEETTIENPLPADQEISVSSDLTVGEENVQIASNLQLDESDNITLGEDSTIENPLPPDFDISVNSDLTIGENNTQLTSDIIFIVSDDLTVGESESMLASDLEIDIEDGLIIGESSNIDVSDLDISITDDLTIGESNIQFTSDIIFTVSDGLVIGETTSQIASDSQITITNGLVIGEASIITVSALNIDAFDDLTIGESQTISTVYNIPTSDDLAIGDSVDITNTNLIAVATDDVAIGEDAYLEPESTTELYINRTDGLTIGESTLEVVSACILDVSDDLTIGEDLEINSNILPDLLVTITPDSVWAIGVRIYP